jgi:hypothetical protein
MPPNRNSLGGDRVGSDMPPLKKVNRPSRTRAAPKRREGSLERVDISGERLE